MKQIRMVIGGILIFFVCGVAVARMMSNLLATKTYPVESSGMTLVTNQISSPPVSQCAKLIFGGDMMFDRHIREKANAQNNYDFIFEDLAPIFADADAIVANLEGPVTEFPSRSVASEVGSTNNYLFTFDPRVATETLARWPFILNLGNNHILNFGPDGLTQTYQNLEKSSLLYFGYTQPNQDKSAYLIKEINGITFGFVNYNQFVDGGKERAMSDIAEVRDLAEVLVLYTHWGNEYVQENQVVKDLAHQFVDAGADLIIGSHPHVVQGVEEYQGKQIYYSLGNFVFDQYFEEAVQNGLLVETKICRSTDNQTFSWEFKEYPIQLEFDGRSINRDSNH